MKVIGIIFIALCLVALGIFYRLKIMDDSQILEPNPDTNDTEFVWVDLKEFNSLEVYPIGIADQILNNMIDNTHFIKK